MAFDILTNIASLQSQGYLRANSDFQTKTIARVTSGLRIVSSGDDAAGLAIANTYRSDQAVLTQGVLNANDGLSQLQIMDGGMSNISMLLDRARTLATQSASGTFTGDRTVLNSEYQSVLGEIDRQAQSIGLNQGGTFAKSLSVFIGGGKGINSSAVINNGSVSVDLSRSVVDTQGLGLKGFTAGYQVAAGAGDSGLYDLGNASVSSVSKILANTGATQAQFVFSGPGFSVGAGGTIAVNANMANVADTASLAAAINAAILGAQQTGSPQAAAFKAANIQAVVHTGADGAQQLQFTSANSTFQVAAANTAANGFMGNLGTNASGSATNATATPKALGVTDQFIAGGTQQTAGYVFTTMNSAAGGTQDKETLTFSALDSTGALQTKAVLLDAGAVASMSGIDAATSINAALQGSGISALQNIVATFDGGASGAGMLTFSSSSTTPFNVTIGQTSGNNAVVARGFAANQNAIVQSGQVGAGATSDISTQAGAQAAVSALSSSVGLLGKSQAVVGKGENQFNYAINLAQSQLTNLGTAESRIRDADLAAEAANLTKAQILMQAGVAALAQANAAPQQVLALLKG